MKKIIPYILISALASGFSWGQSSSEKCDLSKQQAFGLFASADRGVRLETEALIRSLCPDGAASQFINGYALETAGSTERALLIYRDVLRMDPEFAPASGRTGMIFLERKRYDEAAIELTKALKAHPDPVYHKGLAKIFTGKKLYSLALYHYQEALKGFPADAEIYSDVARLYLEAGDRARAEDAFHRSLSLRPGSREPLVGLAAIYSAAGEFDKALDSLKKAEVAAPLDKEIHRLKAGIYQKKGDSANAEAEFLLAGIQPVKSVPKSGEGDRLVAAKEYEKAIEAYSTEITLDPDNGELRQKLGTILMRLGRDDEAIASFREALRYKWDNQELHYNLGTLYEKKGMHDEAVVEYKQALAAAESVDVRYRLADIYTQRGSLQQALEQYKILHNSNPADQQLLMKMGRIYSAGGNVKESASSYKEVIRLNPDNIEAHRELAAIYKKANHLDDLEKEYREIIRLKKGDMDTRNALTSIFVKKKSYDELVSLLKEGIEMTPGDTHQHYKLGLVYEFQKDYKNAAASYEESVKLKEDNAKALNALGRINMKTGHIKEAKEYLEKARAADPNMEEATLLLNNIRDELAPVPLKYKKGKKVKKGKKSKKTKKVNSKTTKKAPAKSSAGQ